MTLLHLKKFLQKITSLGKFLLILLQLPLGIIVNLMIIGKLMNQIPLGILTPLMILLLLTMHGMIIQINQLILKMKKNLQLNNLNNNNLNQPLAVLLDLVHLNLIQELLNALDKTQLLLCQVINLKT